LLSGGSFGGKQLIAVELNYFYSLDFESLLNFSFGKKENISVEKVEKQTGEKTSYSSLMDVAFGQEGNIYTVKGIVTSPKDLLGKGSFYIQDEVSGLMIYAPSFTESLEIGDVVVVTGKSKLWNGIVELVADSIEVVGKDEPKADVLTSLSDVFLSSLVYIEGIVKEKGKYDFVVDTGEFLIKVYLKKGTNIDISNLSEGSKVKVTGILTLYKGEYEILPRGQFDVEVLK
jgi:DNA/RNA endonuclease YhcR with UshA esterase domain